jgi:uncharacterized protein
MIVWIDLANSPHVAVFRPIAERFGDRGDDVVLTIRDHAQTLELARAAWGDVTVVGGASSSRLAQKAVGVAERARELSRFARAVRPDVALSHGSYAQVVAARVARVPAVTMMDYEFQPANHLSFRLANRVVVPDIFPLRALRQFGALAKTVRYSGFKEELYLADYAARSHLPLDLGLDEERTVVVFRPPPRGALYHRHGNDRFDEILEVARQRPDVEALVLPRSPAQAARYRKLPGLLVPEHAVDAGALLLRADVFVGGGGTMSREAALLGTPAFTVFSGHLAAVDAELIRQGRMIDLRDPRSAPMFERKRAQPPAVAMERRRAILDVIERAAVSVARPSRL